MIDEIKNNIVHLEKKIAKEKKLLKIATKLPKELDNRNTTLYESFITIRDVNPIIIIDALKDYILPFTVNKNKLENGYGKYDKEYQNKFPFYFYIKKDEIKLCFYIKIENSILNVVIYLKTDTFRIDYRTKLKGYGCNCYKELIFCNLKINNDLFKKWDKQTWGSIQGEPYSYTLWLNREPKQTDINHMLNALETI